MTICTPTGIGEKIRSQEEQAAEDSKQRAIRCTEEVVRREESQKREDELSRAREEWKKEKQQLFQEAHQNQLRAIARRTTLLEERLKREFQENIEVLETEHREHMDRTVHSTWEEAGIVKENAVAETRLEEQHFAKEEARRVANRVAQEKRNDKEQAECDMAQALEEHTKYMQEVCRKNLAQQQKDLEKQHAGKMAVVSGEYEARLTGMEQKWSDEVAENESLLADVQEMTESKDSWEMQHKNLKVEFSDFIDQFPGFKAEFILK